MCRWIDRLSRYNRGGISQNRGAAMYHTSIRSTTKFVSYKDIKALMADLKKVYTVTDEQTALTELDNFDEK